MNLIITTLKYRINSLTLKYRINSLKDIIYGSNRMNNTSNNTNNNNNSNNNFPNPNNPNNKQKTFEGSIEVKRAPIS